MIHIFGGGTVNYVRAHMAMCAPAYGHTARTLRDILIKHGCPAAKIQMQLTRMADHTSRMETNDDVAARLDLVLADPATTAIIFNVALCDFIGEIGNVASGKHAERLRSREGALGMQLTPSEKLLPRVKVRRPEVFLVGFKTTSDSTRDEQMALAHRQLQETGADLVLANDTWTKMNVLIAGKDTELLAATQDRATILLRMARRILGAKS